jgi:pyruvate,orthophosphate dikinase
MVFGNMGNDSGTGVGFTRNPGTGENVIYGEYLVNAQGEDVVAGIRTPKPSPKWRATCRRSTGNWWNCTTARIPLQGSAGLRVHHREGRALLPADPQRQDERPGHGAHLGRDVQGRPDHQGKGAAAHRPGMLEQLLVPQLARISRASRWPVGLPASPGAASGKIVFDADTAEKRGRAASASSWCARKPSPRTSTASSPQGILTSRGGKTSHAAVVARGMGKPCVSGCEGIHIDDIKRCATIGDTVLHEGDVVTIDGGTGKVYAGEVPTVRPSSTDMETLLSWADQVARLKVMANADTPTMRPRRRGFGAMGIGLCRTERMFNATDRLPIVQEMILAESSEERQAALDRLLPIQRADFKGIFKAMMGLPVTVRLLDPPIHEFLPTAAQLELEIAHLHHLRDSLKAVEELPETLKLLSPRLYQQYADGLNKLSRGMEEFKDSHLEEDVIHKKEKTLKKVRALSEVNPMLGHRGVRLGVTYPEIYEMQIKAILEAAALCAKEGIEVHPEIMVPQVAPSRNSSAFTATCSASTRWSN